MEPRSLCNQITAIVILSPSTPPPRYLSMASITITAAGVISFLISHALPTAEPPLAKPILKSIGKGV